jgi:hypothetical protein
MKAQGHEEENFQRSAESQAAEFTCRFFPGFYRSAGFAT